MTQSIHHPEVVHWMYRNKSDLKIQEEASNVARGNHGLRLWLRLHKVSTDYACLQLWQLSEHEIPPVDYPIPTEADIPAGFI